MVVYGLYLYIIVGYTREILMCCISTVGERVEERVISCKVETYSAMIYGINFHLLPYEFKIDVYVNFGKRWNIKFQAK